MLAVTRGSSVVGRCGWVSAFALLVAGCTGGDDASDAGGGTDGEHPVDAARPVTIDGGPLSDGGPATIDSGPPVDANPWQPDANPWQPDANPVPPDASPSQPDATPVPPDATPVPPDAEPSPDAEPLVGLPYPDRDISQFKGIQPDFWPDIDELVANNTGVISMNMVWAEWEPSRRLAPCGSDDQEYDGHCFPIDRKTDDAIREWSSRGVIVTGVLYGVPGWARVGNTGCTAAVPGFEIFCTPDDPEDFARYAGMLASRYDGLHGHGRIVDFVIHNEVNTNIWFDIGCGQGVPCDTNEWIQTYVDNFAAAYDRIKTHQSRAKVLIPFEHHFDTFYDQPEADFTLLSAKTFTREFDRRIGDRTWYIAYHPYPPNLMVPEFSPFDLPLATFGNVGVISAWLRQDFPDKPHVWEIQITECGINASEPQSSEAEQADAICDTFRNVLGTPGISSYIYHRMQDHIGEGGFQPGLIASNGHRKQGWTTWAQANVLHGAPPRLSCGFEHLPYTRLAVNTHSTVADLHWTSSRRPPADYDESEAWYLNREPAAGTTLLYECMGESSRGAHTLITSALDCDGRLNLGPVGYIWNAPVSGGVALYSCSSGGGADEFVSTSSICGGQTVERLLGYAIPVTSR